LTAKKKLAGALGGVVAIGATVALTAGTFSYFSDSATAPGGSGTVSFGTLALELRAGDGGLQKSFTVTNAKPGATVFQSTDDEALCFKNTGSMHGVLRLKIVPDSASEAFNKAVQIKLDGFGTYQESFPLNEQHSLHDAAALTLNGVNAAQLYAGGDNKCVPITVSIDKNAGNELKGVTGSFSIKADLVQQEDNGIYPADSAQFPAVNN
jgi:hypothetical protein